MFCKLQTRSPCGCAKENTCEAVCFHGFSLPRVFGSLGPTKKIVWGRGVGRVAHPVSSHPPNPAPLGIGPTGFVSTPCYICWVFAPLGFAFL